MKKINKKLMEYNPETFKPSQLKAISYFNSKEWQELWEMQKPKNNLEFLILIRVMSLYKAYNDLKKCS